MENYTENVILKYLCCFSMEKDLHCAGSSNPRKDKWIKWNYFSKEAVYVMLQFLLHYYRYVTNCYSCRKMIFLIHPDFGSLLGYLEDKAVFLPELAFMSFKKNGLFVQ